MDSQLANNLDQLEKIFVSRMNSYEDKLQKHIAGSSTTHPDVSSLSCEFNEFKAFVWETLKTLKSQVELISRGLDKHETFMRRKVLLFHGVPEKQNEKLHETVSSIISNQLKLSDVNINSLQVCHRLGSSSGKTRPILARFYDLEHRQEVWEHKSRLKGSGITVTEFLTQTRHRVFTAARKHFGTKQSWTTDGKVVILLPNNTRRKIDSMSDLEMLISDHPLVSSDVAVDSCQQEGRSPKSGASKVGNAPRKARRR